MDDNESLLRTITRVRRLSDMHYKGRIKEFAMEIFGLLHPEDQNQLLGYFFTVVVPTFLSPDSPPVEQENPPKVYNESADIDIHNQLEIIQLKAWVVKAGFSLIGGSVGFGLALQLALSGSNGKILGMLKDAFSIFTLMTGLDG